MFLAARVKTIKHQRIISHLQDSKGVIQHKTADILNIMFSFYKQLYTSTQPQKDNILS